MTNIKKQTAVEWLIEQITLKKYPNGALLNLFITDKLMEKAKAMEKEQMIKFANDYIDYDEDLTAEEYYNQTYTEGQK